MNFNLMGLQFLSALSTKIHNFENQIAVLMNDIRRHLKEFVEEPAIKILCNKNVAISERYQLTKFKCLQYNSRVRLLEKSNARTDGRQTSSAVFRSACKDDYVKESRFKITHTRRQCKITVPRGISSSLIALLTSMYTDKIRHRPRTYVLSQHKDKQRYDTLT